MIELLKRRRKQFFACCLFVYDMISISLAYLCALYVSYGCKIESIPAEYLGYYCTYIPFFLLLCLGMYYRFNLYHSIWRFISYHELYIFSFAASVPIFIYFVFGILVTPDMPVRYYIIGGWLHIWVTLASRFSVRLLFLTLVSSKIFKNNDNIIERRGMIIGGGAAGQIILRDIISNHNNVGVKILCMIDDDPNKWGCQFNGVPIVGGRYDILATISKYEIEDIYLAMPTASTTNLRDIINICKETKCNIKILPGIAQLVNGEVNITKMRDVSTEELLGREAIKVNNSEILNNLKGQVVLVTGGGGSIGSELCRQIASSNPKQLIIFDIYENNAYDIEQELKRNYPTLNLDVLIGSVRDSRRLRQIFKSYRPNIVFHAAAHKHVPLMESSPFEAIKNNVNGTYKTAYMAMLYGVKKFILISTDKAVNPTNIMGASKRMCEMIIQTMNKISENKQFNALISSFSYHGNIEEFSSSTDFNKDNKTEFVAVRFGNVLGSNGSVIPLFKKQIANGGPVLVTHPDIIRYFMTISEAVNLVLQASSYAKGGEIFVLDMGVPVKIDLLARNLIKLSGYKVDEDIKIEYSGLRPGEKLYEEKLMAEEGLLTTPNKLIHVAQPIEIDIEKFMQELKPIMYSSLDNKGDIFSMVENIVPTYKRKEKEF